jgi:hypothetical protein
MSGKKEAHRRALRGLPPLEEVLRGSVFVRTLRCGKAGCRCATGDGHRATYLSVSFAGGRTEQISLPASLVPVARRWIANYLKWWRAVEKVSAINRRLLRERRDAESGRQSTSSRTATGKRQNLRR